MGNILFNEFIEQSLDRINQNTSKIKSCIKEMDEKETWFSPNGHVNSVGNLILHLCGNIRQYIISSLGGKPDNRERDKEFSASGGFSNAELIMKLQDTVEEAKTIIASVGQEDLLRIRNVQGFSFSGIGIIIHVTEHYSYHTGQIILLTKILKDIDMGFYAGVDLNKKNSN